jgi:hypothetical protein
LWKKISGQCDEVSKEEYATNFAFDSVKVQKIENLVLLVIQVSRISKSKSHVFKNVGLWPFISTKNKTSPHFP